MPVVKLRALFASSLVLCVLMHGGGSAHAQAAAKAVSAKTTVTEIPELLLSITAKQQNLSESMARKVVVEKTAVRARATNVNFSVLRNIRSQMSLAADRPMVRIPFFDDAILDVEITSIEITSSGGLAYIGRVSGEAHSIAVMVDNAGVLSINVNSQARKFAIHGSPDAGYVATEMPSIDRPDHPPRSPYLGGQNVVSGLEIAKATAADPVPGPETQADDGSTMDVMVIYTSAARLAQTPGTTAQMNANIDAQIALTNTVYANSNVVQRLRLVYKGEVNYTEVNMDTDLTRLLNASDGFLDEAAVLRNLYAADFVSFWGVYSDYCGLGSLMTNESSASNAPRAYNTVASPNCTSGNSYTFAHELGHNMGLRHDNYMDSGANSVTPEAGGALVSIAYAHGYVDLANRFRTVMSYNDQCVATFGSAAPTFGCTRIPRFSNPSVSYTNNPPYPSATSAPTGSASNANERQALNDVRETTANFRTALPSLTGPGVVVFLPGNTLSVAEGSGSASVRVERHVGSTGAISVAYHTSNGTATAGSDYSLTSGTLSWADGETGAKFIAVPITQDAFVDANETFSVTLDTPAGGASIGTQGGIVAITTVTIIDDDDPGVVVFSPVTNTVAEGGGMVQLRARRTVGSKGSISVAYATANGTATAGADFTTAGGTLSWNDGDTSDRTFNVSILQDTTLEGTEAFAVALSSPTGGASIGIQGGVTTSATVNITDDDPDNFPPGGVVPLEYTTPSIPAGTWEFEPASGYLSPTSLRSAQARSAAGDFTNFTNSDLVYTGDFLAGNVTFAYRISSYHDLYQQFDFLVDGVVRVNHPGGESGWLTASIPVTAGAHTLTWRFKSRLPFFCAGTNPAPPGGANCANRAYVDSVILPLTGNTLSVVRGGNGVGTVSGTGIVCGTNCTEVYAANTMVSLTATPGAGSLFAGWSGGGCSGTGTCTVTMSSAQTVFANFDLLPEPFPTNCAIPAGFITPAGATTGWSVSTDRARTGACSLKSGAIGESQGPGQFNKAQIETSGNFTAGNVSFYYNVSSELNYDCFRFLIDDVQQAVGGTCSLTGGVGASGNVSTWTLVSIPVSAGVHKLTWSYEKDNDVAANPDAAWIDDVALPPLAPAGTLQFASATASVAEGSGNATLSVTRSGGSNGAVSVNYATATGTASGSDFTAQSAALNWADGETATKTIVVPITSDSAIESDETFTVTLSSPVGATLGAITTMTVTILDDDTIFAPGAPTIGTAIPGNTVATISFTPPASTGGSAIIDYTVACDGGSASKIGTMSPITVTGLTNNSTYICSVTARNVVGPSVASGTVNVTPSAGAALALVSVKSRKVHGQLGSFDVPITPDIALSGLVSVEQRSSTSHAIVFELNNTVNTNTPGAATVVDGSGPIGSAAAAVGIDPREVIVTLTGIPDNKRVTVTLIGVNGSFNTSASMGFLVGDVGSNRVVNASDISAVKARQNLTVDNTNARFDIDANGAINQADVTAAKARSGRAIP